jgi:hypothetical protein
VNLLAVPVRSSSQPTTVSVTNPERFPSELISAMPAAAAAPRRYSVGSTQKTGTPAMIPALASPTRRANRPPDQVQDFIDGYVETRGTIDDDPNHLPLPHGVDHRYRSGANDTQRADGYAVDAHTTVLLIFFCFPSTPAGLRDHGVSWDRRW